MIRVSRELQKSSSMENGATETGRGSLLSEGRVDAAGHQRPRGGKQVQSTCLARWASAKAPPGTRLLLGQDYKETRLVGKSLKQHPLVSHWPVALVGLCSEVTP